MPIDFNKIFVVILAGGKNSKELHASSGIEYGADMRLDKTTMFTRTLHAIRGTGFTKPTMVYALGPTVPRSAENYTNDRGHSHLSMNVRLGAMNATSEWILYVATDMPFLSSDDITAFLEACNAAPEADVYYPVATVAACQALCPGMSRTILPLDGKEYSGGNIFLLRKKAILNSWPQIEKLIAARKNPLKLAQLVGVKTAARLILHRIGLKQKLTQAQAESLGEKLLKAKCRMIICPNGNLVVDLDKAEHWKVFGEQFPERVK